MGFAAREGEAAQLRGYSRSAKSVCPDHLDDTVLKKRVNEYATEPTCSYCDKTGTDDNPIAAIFDNFMDCFMVGVHHRFARANDEAVSFEDGEYIGATTYDSYEVAEEIFGMALNDYIDEADAELLDDIQAVMCNDAWVRGDWQSLSEDQRLSYNWDAFKDLVKYQTRFLFIRWAKRHPYDPDEMSPLEFFEALVSLLVGLPEAISSIDGPMYRGECSRANPILTSIRPPRLDQPRRCSQGRIE